MTLLELGFIEVIKLESIVGVAESKNTRVGRLKRLNKCIDYQKKHGVTWLISTEIGLLNAELENYVDSLLALETSYKLKPKKPLSPYNLSTLYRMLAKASYSDTDYRVLMTNQMSEKLYESSTHPSICKQVIEELGIDHETVLNRYFECSYTTLELILNKFQPEDKKLIETNIAMMKVEYPGYDHISIKNYEKRYLQSILLK